MTYRPLYSDGGNWILIGDYWVRLSDGYRLTSIRGGTSANTVMENIWAFGDDDGSESGHTLDTENTARTSQAMDTPFMIRMMARETAGKVDPWAMYIYCSYNGGTFTELTTAGSAGMPAYLTNDANSRADDEATTQRMSAPAGGSWVAGYYDDGTSAVGTSNIGLNNTYAEWEFCVAIDSTYASGSDEFEFRIQGSGTALDSYAGVTYPKATATAGAASLTVAPLSQSNLVQFITGMTKESTLTVDPLSQSNLVQFITGMTQESDLVVDPLFQSNLVEFITGMSSQTELTVENLYVLTHLDGLGTTYFADGFESGDTTAWDSTNGPVVVNGTSAIDGSYGIENSFDQADDYVRKNIPNWSKGRIKFKIDTNTITGDYGDYTQLVSLRENNDAFVELQLYKRGTIWHSFDLYMRKDDLSYVANSSGENVASNTTYAIEIEWRARNDFAYVISWRDGSPDRAVRRIDSSWTANNVRFGLVDTPTQYNSGSYYLDTFELISLGVDLTQVHNLQVKDLSQSNTVEKPTLATVAALSIANLSQATSVAQNPPLFKDGFESGGTGAWTGTNGSPTINGTAALDGSYGFELPYNAGLDYVYLSWTNSTEQVYRVKFKVDVSTLSKTNGQWESVVALNDGDYAGWCGIISIGQSGGVLRPVVYMHRDDDSYNEQAGSSISGTVTIEAEFHFAYTTGYCDWWIDGVPQTSLTGQNTGTRFPDLAWFGGVEDNSGSEFSGGSLYLDSFELYDGTGAGLIELEQTRILQVDDLSQSNTVEHIDLTSYADLSVKNLSQVNTVQMANLFSFPFFDGFETGDTSRWQSEVGTVVINGSAALDGSYGIEGQYNDSNQYASWVIDEEQRIRVEIKFDNNTLDGANGRLYFFSILDGNSSRGALNTYYSGSAWNIEAYMRNPSLQADSVQWWGDTFPKHIFVEWDFTTGFIVIGNADTGNIVSTKYHWAGGTDSVYIDQITIGTRAQTNSFTSGTGYFDSVLVNNKIKTIQPKSLSQSNTVEKPTLSGAGILAPQTLTQANVVEKVSLTQIHNLQVDDLSQSNLVEHVSTTKESTLAVYGLLQTNALKTQISDNFNRANGGLGPNWTTMTGKTAPVIASNLVNVSVGDTLNCAFWSANTFDNDQWASARLPASFSADYGPGIAVRISGETCYILYYGNTNNRVTLWRMDGDLDWTVLQESGDLTITPATDIWKISVVGNVITGYQNGNQVVQTTDSNYGTGQPGVWLYYDRNDLDDFVAEGASLRIEQVHNLQVDDLSQSTAVEKLTLSAPGALAVKTLTQANSVDKVSLTQIHNLSVDDLSQATAVDKIPVTKQSTLTVDNLSVNTLVTPVTLVQIHNLSVDSLVQSNLVGSITLIQLHILAIDNLLQSNLVEKVSMSGDQFLTVDNLSQASLVEKLSLAQLHILTINGLSQSNLVLPVVLTQVHVLAVHNLSQGNSVPKIQLSAEGDATARNLSQSSTVDKVSLTQVHNLSVDDLAQSNLVESIALSQFLIMTVENLSQSNTVEKVSLTQLHVLSVDSLSQDNTVEEVILSQVHVLSVHDLSQSTQVTYIPLSTEGTVTPFALSSTSSVETFTLVQQHNANVYDLSQLSTVESIALVPVPKLVIYDLAQANSTDYVGVTTTYYMMVYDLAQANNIELATWGAKLVVANLNVTSTLWNSSFWQEQFEWEVGISRYLYEDVTIDTQTNMIPAGIDRQSDVSEVDL